MKTKSKEKIEKAERLHQLIQERKRLDAEEKELKDWAKLEATDGVLEAGDIIITLEKRTRTNIDRELLANEIGQDGIRKVSVESEYLQVNVKARAA